MNKEKQKGKIWAERISEMEKIDEKIMKLLKIRDSIWEEYQKKIDKLAGEELLK